MTSIQIDRTDGLSSSTAIKGPCRVATTGNISLSGLQTVDGVALVVGDRVVVKDQSAGSENGIWIADTGPWRRSTDFNKTRDVVAGTLVYVTDGLTGRGGYQISTGNPITVGTSSIEFASTESGGVFATHADFASAAISPAREFVELVGYSAPGDGGGHIKKPISTPSPVKPWQEQSADGAWWQVAAEDHPSVRMFGGSPTASKATNDAAFTALQDYVQAFDIANRIVDLEGQRYPVTVRPYGACYFNGRFIYDKTATINGVADPYTFEEVADDRPDTANTSSLFNDARSSNAVNQFTLTETRGIVSAVCDVVNANIYALALDQTSGERGVISVYNMDAIKPRAASSSMLPSYIVGHQGLAIEQFATGHKLWASGRYHASYPNGSRQVIRFTYQAGVDPATTAEVYTLFGSDYTYIGTIGVGHSCMPTISWDQRYLAVLGRKTGARDFWCRVFDLKMLQEGGPGDYSTRWLHEFQIDREILTDNDNGNAKGTQNLCFFGDTLVILNSTSDGQAYSLHAYTIKGVRLVGNKRVSVGLSAGSGDGGGNEPESLLVYQPLPGGPPRLAIGVMSGPTNNKTNRFWVLSKGAPDRYFEAYPQVEAAGKLYYTMGDSTAHGSGTHDGYAKIAAAKLGLRYNDLCVNGARFGQKVPDDGRQVICDNITNIPTTAEYITFQAGTNDYSASIPIGVMSDRVRTTFYGAVHRTCILTLQRCPKAKIAFITPFQRGDDALNAAKQYVDIIKEVAAFYSIPVLDLYSAGSLRPYLAEQKTEFFTDDIHPNLAGEQFVANRVAKFLDTL